MSDELLAPRRVKVTDVARVAGVSPGTVSNALSGKRHVNADTRKRIEEAIEELGYVPNLTARQMRTGRSNTIAIVSSMPVAVAAGPSKLGFLMELAASAAVTALDFNSALILLPPIDDPVSALGQLSVDGAIIVEPENNDQVLEALTRRRVPTVCIGATTETDIPNVALDYKRMADLLIDHLFETGATRFPLVVGKSDRQTHRCFRETYLARMKAAGCLPRLIEVAEQEAEEGAANALSEELLQDPTFDAVLVPVDAMATGVMRALRRAERQVPGDVRVATRYDGLRARQEAPPLTAIDLQLDSVASVATKSLLELIEGNSLALSIDAPPPKLIARPSTCLA